MGTPDGYRRLGTADEVDDALAVLVRTAARCGPPSVDRPGELALIDAAESLAREAIVRYGTLVLAEATRD